MYINDCDDLSSVKYLALTDLNSVNDKFQVAIAVEILTMSYVAVSAS